MNAHIYKNTNTKVDKSYIGYTTKDVEKRFSEHKKMSTYNNINSNTPLYRAMRKDGVENFEVSVLYSSNNIEDTFSKMEDYYIRICDTMKPSGYNSKPGGKQRSNKKKKI